MIRDIWGQAWEAMIPSMGLMALTRNLRERAFLLARADACGG